MNRYKAGYLSTADDKSFTKGAITVVGTGATPLELITSVSPRHYFYDGPLERLDSEPEFTSLISPIASTDFEGVFGTVLSGEGLNKTQVDKMRSQVEAAHEKKVCYSFSRPSVSLLWGPEASLGSHVGNKAN